MEQAFVQLGTPEQAGQLQALVWACQCCFCQGSGLRAQGQCWHS